MTFVRPCQMADISHVVRLREKCFRASGQKTRQLAESRFRKIFFENPWYRPDVASLVAENSLGAIVGFLGVVPRPMKMRGEKIWMAVNTQLMADPDANAADLVGVTLLQASMNGPLDFTFADLASDQSTRIWAGLGGQVERLYSLYWTRPLRPAQYAIPRWNAGKPTLRTRVANRALRPLASLADHYLAKGAGSVYAVCRPDCESLPIEPRRLRELYDRFLERRALTPDYGNADLEWLIADISAQSPDEQLLKVMEVRDVKGNPLGWFVYIFNNGGAVHVVQLGGRGDRIDKILAALFYEAFTDGALYVSGRVQPEHLPYLGEPSISLSRHGPWVCTSTKRGPLREEILEGRAWLTRLEGEWWMNF